MRKTFDCIVGIAARICMVAGIVYLGEAIYEKGKNDGIKKVCTKLEELVKEIDSKDEESA